MFDAQNDSSSHPLPSLFRLICGITMKRWWDGWRGNSLKKRAQGPSLTRTSSTSAEITSSSRYAGDDSEQCRFSVVKSATNVHPSLTPTAHPKNTQYPANDVVFFCFFQPCSSQSRGRHGFYCAHDPAHLSHTENRGGAYPVHYGDVGLLLVGSLASPPCLAGWIKPPAQPHPLLANTWTGNWDWRSQREGPWQLPGYWWTVGYDSY